MARQEYKEFNFRNDTMLLIQTIDGICQEYMQDGYTMTVRQLYYQLVARDIVPNTEKSYKRITDLVNNARLAGLIDWDAIEDRTREFNRRGRWASGASILRSVASQFHMDSWKDQATRVFCIVEKEALAGVLDKVTFQYDMPLLAARGYPSSSVLREFALEDIIPSVDDGQRVVILHLGDHDPSGLDMTRDLDERTRMFSEEAEIDLTIKRIALNMDQIRSQRPPPNPAKTTDARFADYEKRYGKQSWELDALSPKFLNELVETNVKPYIDFDIWNERSAEIQDVKNRLEKVSKDFE